MCKLSRAWLTTALVDEVKVNRFFEVGVGDGSIMVSLARKGLSGRGIDISESAVQTCQQHIRAEGLAGRLIVRRGDLLDRFEDETEYDLVIASEVLEHIADDRGALRALRELVTSDGHLVVTVPAHMRMWSAQDVWAGHKRRYERDELREKLEASQFIVREFLSHGYPLYNLTRPLRHRLYARALKREETTHDRTLKSGLDGPASFLSPLPPLYSWLVHQLQKPFLHTDLGEGYFVLAQRAG